jgi:hypothetical protein
MEIRTIRPAQILALMGFAIATISAQAPTPTHFTAITANVSGAGEPIKINLNGWSTDAQRDQFVAAWTMKNQPSPAPAEGPGGRGGRGAGGRGGRGARGARGAADGASDSPADPDAVDADNPAFRFGRGGARGAVEEAPQTPVASLTSTIKKAPTLGILWTSENVGYSIKYAYRISQPDGGERIILVTDRRIGAWSNLWKPTAAVTPQDYAFSIIELRLNSKGEGEGRGPLGGKVSLDNDAKTIDLDNYSVLPTVFKGLKRQVN